MNGSLKRWTARFLTIAMLVQILAYSVPALADSAESDTVTNAYGTVQFVQSGEEFELRITDYQTAAGNNDSGRATALIDPALQKYNVNHSVEKTMADITKITVIAADEEQYLVGCDFNVIRGIATTEPVLLDLSSVNIAHGAFTKSNLSDTNKNKLSDGAFQQRLGIKLKEIRLPASLQQIGNSQFQGQAQLASFVFPENLTFIGTTDAISNPSSTVGAQNPNRMFFYQSAALTDIACHSRTYDEELWIHMLGTLAFVNYTTVNFANSNVPLKALQKLKGTVAHIDLEGCDDASLGTETDGYAALKAWLDTTAIKAILPNGSVYPDPLIFVSVKHGKSYITVEDGNIVTLHFENYNNMGTKAYGAATRTENSAWMLMNGAVECYNAANGFTEESAGYITQADIKRWVIATAGGYISHQERNFVKAELPQIEEIDLSQAEISNGYWPNAANKNILFNLFGGQYADKPTDANGALAYLKKVTLPDTLVEFSVSAFQNCIRLQEVNIPATVTRIGARAFMGCESLQNVTLPEGLKILDDNVFNGCAALTELALPSTLIQIQSKNANLSSGLFAKDSGIVSVSFHGTAIDSENPEAFFHNLVLAFPDAVRMDLHDSGIDTVNALKLKDTLKYLDLRGCFNLEYISENGLKLKNKLDQMIAKGAEVYMPSPDEVANKFVVSVSVNDKSMGSIKGGNVFDTETVPHECTLTATPASGYTLLKWLVNEEEMPAGQPQENGTFTLQISVSGTTAVQAVFEINDTVAIPAGNEITVGANGKLHITLSNIEDRNNIGLYTQILLKRLNADREVPYTPADISAITLSTAEGVTISGMLSAIFPDSFSAALMENLETLDVSKVQFTNAALPASFASSFAALKTVLLPANITTISGSAFQNCAALQHIDLPDSLKIIGQAAFRQSGIETIEFPEGLEEIQNGAFQVCKDFKGSDNGTLYLPSTLKVFAHDKIVGVVGGTSESRFILFNTKVSGISFHGEGSDKLFSNLIGCRDWSSCKYDFKGSGITEKQLSRIPFSTTGQFLGATCQYDLRECPIDYTTTRGKALKRKIENFTKQCAKAIILWDEGIIRDNSYTVIKAEITVSEGQTAQAAITEWCAAQTPAVEPTSITDLTLKTAANCSLNATDFAFLKTINQLRILDLSGAKCLDGIIPDNALSDLDNMNTFVFPDGITEIGKSAFYMTDLITLQLPVGLQKLGAGAFSDCYSLEGTLVLPNTLTDWGGSDIFKDSGFTRLEYHGPLDIQLRTSFAYGMQTLEYVDLRGCTGLNESNVPFSGWEVLQVLLLDYCSFSKIPDLVVNLIYEVGCTVTMHHQNESFDLETMLKESPFGKPSSAYPSDVNTPLYTLNPFYTENTGDDDQLMLTDRSKLAYEYLVEEEEIVLNPGVMQDVVENIENAQQSGGGKKVVVVTKRRKKKKAPAATEEYVVDWGIVAAVAAAVIVLSGGTAAAIILIKRKKKLASADADLDIKSNSSEGEL